MFCPKCGTENPDGSRFCKNCGQQMQAAPMPNPVPMQNQPFTQTTYTNVPHVARVGGAAANPAIARMGNNKKLFLIIGIVVAVLIVAIAIFGISRCVMGSGLKAGTYTLASNGSSYSLEVKKDRTIQIVQDGQNLVFAYDKSGNQGGSTIYDLKLKTYNGQEVQYDKDNNITNAAQLSGSGSSASAVPVKVKMQIMVPKGGTYNTIVGDWGLSFYTSDNKGDSSYDVVLYTVSDGGTGQLYYAHGSDDEMVPGMRADEILGKMNSGNRSSSGAYSSATQQAVNWRDVGNNTYVLIDTSSSKNNEITISMPH